MNAASPLRRDVHDLIESSLPRPGAAWVLRYALGLFLLLVLIKAYVASRWPEHRVLADGVASLLILGLFSAVMITSWRMVRLHRHEQEALQSVEELMQLRRWPEAIALAEGLLSRPARTPSTRTMGLLYLSSILARYQRYQDAIAVQEAILEEGEIDPGTEFALRVARAMALLHEDRLVDADRAMSELRRASNAEQSAALALVEMYRDVKTGHPAEALEVFHRIGPGFRQQLGHRAADAHALAAAAADMLGMTADAARHYRNATLLGSEGELHRRYAEVARLAGRYPAVTPPGGEAQHEPDPAAASAPVPPPASTDAPPQSDTEVTA